MSSRAKQKNDTLPERFAGGRVHGSVVDALGSQILGGRYKPGDILPREDELAAQLGVSRTSLREAIKVLGAKGLLETRQRVGARVRARGDWHLLDPAVLSWHPDIRRDSQLMSGLLEARRIIEPAAAELAALRASAADLAVIENAYLAMERSIPDDLDGCCEADLAFHVGIIAASGNIVLKGLSGTIEAALGAAFLITNPLMSAQSRALTAHREVVERIRFRDGPGAYRAMHALLDIAVEDLDQTGLPLQPDTRISRATFGRPAESAASAQTRPDPC